MATTSFSLQQACGPVTSAARRLRLQTSKNSLVIASPVSRPCSLSFSSAFADSLPLIPCGLSKTTRALAGRQAPLVLAMADEKPKKKVDSAVKRAKQAEAHRVYNKSRRTEMSTRMKKVFKALEDLRRSPTPNPEDLGSIEKLISEAYTIIDKSVKVGTIHKNKGARRKSRLARAKRDVSIALGWYTPADAQVVEA